MMFVRRSLSVPIRSVALVTAVVFPLAAQTPAHPAPRPAAKSSAHGDVLPLPVTETTLANGLRVIVVPTGFPNLVSIQVPVQTGSRNEVEAGKSGFAHFFEHIMFRGTPRFPSDRYNEVMNQAGARHNAFTTDDFTNYHSTFAKENLEQVIELMGDQFQHLAYDEPTFKTEARAVLGEYNKNSANPGFKLFEATRAAAFTTHTYGHTTMGFIKDIENMPNQYEYSKLFHDRWYRPEYTTVIVAGDVTAAKVLPLVRKYWGSWPRGSYKATIPAEPPPTGPKYVHVDWPERTNPLVNVSFRNPAFSETNPDNAAMDMVANLWFGQTSDLFKTLVVKEQKVDFVGAGNTSNADPELFTIQARVKKPEDVKYVRDMMIATAARARDELVSKQTLDDAKSAERYAFVRSMNNTDAIASTIANFVRYRRAFATVNNAYRMYDRLTPELLRDVARRYFTDANMIVSTASNGPLPSDVAQLPALAQVGTAMRARNLAINVAGNAAGTSNADAQKKAIDAKIDAEIERSMKAAQPMMANHSLPKLDLVMQKSSLPQIEFKLLFSVGSADDPPGKEGLAALSSAMISGAGSTVLTYDEINRALQPMAGSFGRQVDKEMTTFTGSVHVDNWHRFMHIVLPQLTMPGFREEDFRRVKDAQRQALTQGLRSNNEEELGKERLQTMVFAGTPYGHPVLGTVAGIDAITLDDVRQFLRDHYTRANLIAGLSGNIPAHLDDVLAALVSDLPAGIPRTPRPAIVGQRPRGMNVEIIQKETRATAISFGLPIQVTRTHPDFAALQVLRSWLGEHRQSNRLFERIRETRGMNYGDYAYIEAFPRGMFQFFPDPNVARRAQLFEIWIRPVVPENAQMALRIATYELQNVIDRGMTQQDFERTRDYLMKNVYVMTATQDQRLGYSLDSKWLGTTEFPQFMRERLGRLTLADVNNAIRRHLSATDVDVVIITKDAQKLRDALVADSFSPITYDGTKPQSLLDEDKIIGARKLNITPDRIHITPVEEIFAR